jgi:hypothetical protein
LTLAAGSLLLATAAPAQISRVEAAATQQTAYVTGTPVPAWLGLATPDGRDAIQLADDCNIVVPGVNVVEHRLENMHLALQVVDPILGPQSDVCEVVGRRHMSDVPCSRNTEGVCDVAFS